MDKNHVGVRRGRAIMPILVGMLASVLISSCRSHESVVSERVTHDTAWAVSVAQGQRNDSVMVYERVRIEPRIVRVGDTTIVNMDTIIYKETVRNFYDTQYVYRDVGKVSTDSAGRETVRRESPAARKTETEAPRKDGKWRMLLAGMAAGVLLSICVKHRKAIGNAIIRLARRLIC